MKGEWKKRGNKDGKKRIRRERSRKHERWEEGKGREREKEEEVKEKHQGNVEIRTKKGEEYKRQYEERKENGK